MKRKSLNKEERRGLLRKLSIEFDPLREERDRSLFCDRYELKRGLDVVQYFYRLRHNVRIPLDSFPQMVNTFDWYGND